MKLLYLYVVPFKVIYIAKYTPYESFRPQRVWLSHFVCVLSNWHLLRTLHVTN